VRYNFRFSCSSKVSVPFGTISSCFFRTNSCFSPLNLVLCSHLIWFYVVPSLGVYVSITNPRFFIAICVHFPDLFLLFVFISHLQQSLGDLMYRNCFLLYSLSAFMFKVCDLLFKLLMQLTSNFDNNILRSV
jgi:hypothetical protein